MATTHGLVLTLALGCGRVSYTPGVDSDGSIDLPRVEIGLDTSMETEVGLDTSMETETRSDIAVQSVVPSNVGRAVALDSGSADLVIGDDAFVEWVVDTNSGNITAHDVSVAATRMIRPAGSGNSAGIVFQLVPQEGGAPPLAVFAVRRLDVRPGGTLRATGDSPLVVLVSSEALLDGTVSVRAEPTRAGPGGSRGGAGGGNMGEGPGGGASAIASLPYAGGGGGSFGGTGGVGGPSTAAGTPYGTMELIPLVGGSGGGGGASSGGTGGHGGGAVQITAGEQLEVAGTIDASGSGGQGGRISSGSGGGGGGGSAGSILLEAPTVTITGFVGASGGAGGQGTQTRWMVVGIDGNPGDPLRAPAPGSASMGQGAGGGAGSDADGIAGSGARLEYCGGGGGGAGRVRINTRFGTEAFDRGILPTTGSGLATIGTVQLGP